jgi:hypothetical protein
MAVRGLLRSRPSGAGGATHAANDTHASRRARVRLSLSASAVRKRASRGRGPGQVRVVPREHPRNVGPDARSARRLFRKRWRVRQRGRSRWVSRCRGRGGLGSGKTDGPDRAFRRPFQARAAAIWWLCSFSRLCVAVISRHSDLAAALPRRWKRSIRRLNFVCPNTGSIIAWRFR